MNKFVKIVVLPVGGLVAGITLIGVASGASASPAAVPAPPVASAPAAPAPAPNGGITAQTWVDNGTGQWQDKAAPAPAPAAPAQTGPLTTVTDGGGYEVGKADDQLKPGKWATTGASDGTVPYAVVHAANGDIVKWVNVDGPYTITLKAGQTFETHGGVTWTLKG